MAKQANTASNHDHVDAITNHGTTHYAMDYQASNHAMDDDKSADVSLGDHHDQQWLENWR
jgi:hypothetical protein